jgi:hypothetical protein
MEREGGSIHGVLRRVFSRRNLTQSSLSYLAMENQKGKESRKS